MSYKQISLYKDKIMYLVLRLFVFGEVNYTYTYSVIPKVEQRINSPWFVVYRVPYKKNYKKEIT